MADQTTATSTVPPSGDIAAVPNPNTDVVIVTRIVSHEFGNSRPLIPAQDAAATDVINNGVNATQGDFNLVVQLPLAAFITLNVSQQWANTQAHLWRSLQIAFNQMNLNSPGNWSPNMTIGALAAYFP